MLLKQEKLIGEGWGGVGVGAHRRLFDGHAWVRKVESFDKFLKGLQETVEL